MINDVAIRVAGLSKCYQIYGAPRDRLKQFVLPRLRRLMGLAPKQYFKEFWAVRDISCDIGRGETVGIIGRNGSGKSTLLQIICGTLSPTAGRVETNGRVAALLELGSGFNPEFTGRENVYLNGAVLGLTRQQMDERLVRILEFADIGDFIDQPVKTYSSGMFLRLAFSVIAHVDPDILVIDEALSVGDAFFVQKCMRFLREFMKRGTVVFVSHDTAAVINLCDRVIWLRDGKVAEIGPPKHVTALYLEDLYLGEDAPQTIDPAPDTAQALERGVNVALRDMRQDMINASPSRNDIQIFDFKRNARAFGVGGAQIVGAVFVDEQSRPLSWIVGGETVTLRISCRAHTEITGLIVGFEVYDRLGQTIFGDNTYLTTQHDPVVANSADLLLTTFKFQMPVMREGDYTMSLAIAEGTQADHVQHQWMHDALAFHVHSASICLGLVGVPMQEIRIVKLS